MQQKAFISGCEGTRLSDEEIAFFREQNPWGYIVFARNIESRDQLRALTDQMRDCAGRDNVPILIDEEGGRVQRLRPPHWISNPPGRSIGLLFKSDPEQGKRAAWALSRLIAHDLLEVGINVDCLPVLDIPQPGAHDVIGDRAYSDNPDVVSILGGKAAKGLIDGGVLPIIKHIPGHGRSQCDSHLELPVVDCDLKTLKATDFKPFVDLAHLPMAMTAHIIYSAVDPSDCATRSKTVIDQIIRGHIGFDGLLMSDDLSMQALSGDYAQRTKTAFGAGCDIVLHCNGLMEQMREIAATCPVLDGEAKRRADAALAMLNKPASEDVASLREEFDVSIATLTA